MNERLTFWAFVEANIARQVHFRNAKGENFNGEGGAWTLGDWMVALAGEVGEAANLLKKVRRGDFTLDEARSELAREIADVITYLALLSHHAGIDLEEAVRTKWNEVSERVGYPVRL